MWILAGILGTLYVAFLLIQRHGGDRIVFGGQERPERIVGGQVQLADIELPDQPPLEPLTGTVTAFDERTKSYRLVLSPALETAAGSIDSVDVRSSRTGHPFSSINGWSSALVVKVALGALGKSEANATLYRYPPNATVRRLAAPVALIAAGLLAAVHGAVSGYGVYRLDTAGRNISAHVAGTRVKTKSGVNHYKVCYDVYDERTGKFYGPEWYLSGDSCAPASPGQYDIATLNPYITVMADPENLRFNSLSAIGPVDYLRALGFLLGGLAAVVYAFIRARR